MVIWFLLGNKGGGKSEFLESLRVCDLDTAGAHHFLAITEIQSDLRVHGNVILIPAMPENHVLPAYHGC